MAGPRRPGGTDARASSRGARSPSSGRQGRRSPGPARPPRAGRPDRSGRARGDDRALDRVDGPRGQRDGDVVVERRQRSRGRRRLMGLLTPLVLLVGVVLVAVFPLQNLRSQREATAAAEAELAEVRAERERVQRETELLGTDEEIERRAREDYGYQRPGEEIYNVLPSPTDPIGLPDTWPFAGVERALGAR